MSLKEKKKIKKKKKKLFALRKQCFRQRLITRESEIERKRSSFHVTERELSVLKGVILRTVLALLAKHARERKIDFN